MIKGKVKNPGLLIPVLAVALNAAEYRCGLSSLTNEDAPAFAVGALRSAQAVDATGSKLFTSTHFAIWYRTGNDSDALESPWDAPATGDSVPRMVRSTAEALERAWSIYVDSMGMKPPLPAPTGSVIGGETPAGLYPVEFCRPERSLRKSYWSSQFYGLTNPYGPDPNRSTVLLSARVLRSSWSYPLDTGGRFAASYRVGDGWLEAMRATAVHELFHASQFRYERTLRHFLFEASAVAMEGRVLPDNLDHLYYLAALFGQLEGAKSPTRGVLVAYGPQAYRHGLYVSGLVADRGDGTLARLWDDRAVRASQDATGSTILGTMSSILDGSEVTWRESLIRYGMRIALGGRRRNWTTRWDAIPTFHPWAQAALAPIDDSILEIPPASGEWMGWSLEGGELRFVADPSISGDLQVHWIADDGAFLLRIDSTPAGFARRLVPAGTTIVPASERSASIWIVGCDGTSATAANPNRATGAVARLSFSKPRSPVATGEGQRFRYVFPLDTLPDGTTTGGQILSGLSRTGDSVLPVLDSGAFRPDPAADREGATLAASGSTWFLSDARGKLLLDDAVLEFPRHAEPFVFRSVDTRWIRSSTSPGGGDTLLARLGTLSLEEPSLWILSGARSVTPEIAKVYPNPSLGGQPVRFELTGTPDGIRLVVLAADGALVRSWRGEQVSKKIEWNLRNEQGNLVRPGVYTWILEGPGLSRRGRLLVGR